MAAAAGCTDVIALLAFHGSAFNGWQSQAHSSGRFVQAVSEEGLTRALGGAHRASLLATSRTDAGVHARQMLVRTSVPTPALRGQAAAELASAWNAQLPSDVRVARLRYALPSQIQVKFASLGKCYSFYVRSGGYKAGLPLGDYTMYVAGLHRPQALQRLATALALFRGAQDFGAFSMGRKAGSSAVAAGAPGGNVRLLSCADVTLLAPSQVQWGLEHPAPGVDAGTRIAAAEGALEAEEAAAAAAAAALGASAAPAPSLCGGGSAGRAATAAAAAAAASAATAATTATTAATAPCAGARAALAGGKRPREIEEGVGGASGSASSRDANRESCLGEEVHLIRMRFIGDGFLRHQIRLMVGAALDVVRGGTSLRDIASALKQGKRSAGGAAGAAAEAPGAPPPQRRFTAASGRGLWLEEVVTHADLWSAEGYCNNRDPAFLKDNGLTEAHWYPARLKRGGAPMAGWVERGGAGGGGRGRGGRGGWRGGGGGGWGGRGLRRGWGQYQ